MFSLLGHVIVISHEVVITAHPSALIPAGLVNVKVQSQLEILYSLSREIDFSSVLKQGMSPEYNFLVL
jgi:hypothetical protein